MTMADPSGKSGATRACDLFVPDFEPANTRERLIMTATNLFYEHGIHAVGLDRVINEVGVTKTTFYNHFESKDDLVLEAMRWRDRWERELWMKMIDARAGNDPRARLLAFFDVLDVWFNDPRFRGCLFINAAAEFPALHDPAHQVAREHVLQSRAMAGDLARSAGAAEPDAFADEFVAVVSGVIVMRQVTGDDRAARIGRRIAEHLLQDRIG